MGTEQPMNAVGVTDTKEPNYDEMDEEHRKLLHIIREHTSGGKAEPTEFVGMRPQVPPTCEDDKDTVMVEERRTTGKCVKVTLFIMYNGADSLENVNLSVCCSKPVFANQETIVLPSLGGNRAT